MHFCGTLDRDEMAALYRSASVVINPSRVDNMPNSVLEAMASGVPVVSTNVGGVPFILREDVTGLLVPRADPEAMAAAVLRVLGDPGSRRAGLPRPPSPMCSNTRGRGAGTLDGGLCRGAWRRKQGRLVGIHRLRHPGASRHASSPCRFPAAGASQGPFDSGRSPSARGIAMVACRANRRRAIRTPRRIAASRARIVPTTANSSGASGSMPAP